MGSTATADLPPADVAGEDVAGEDVTVPWPQRILTAAIVFGPLLGLGYAVVRLWGRGVSARDLVLAVVMYAVVGHGVTVGFHRLFAHRSFKAARGLKIALAVLGSMSFQGTLIGWVASHRRHHAFTDRPGDPHSPYLSGTGAWARMQGFVHAHMGWLFKGSATAERRFAPDLLADRDLVVINALFPLWCVISLALPFVLGWVLGGGRLSAALSALVWAGAVRVCLLHHVTWSVNSVCHVFGNRPFRTRPDDRATNFAPLAVLSMGESWHNAHHAFPYSARHGVDRHQLDSSAAVIRVLERLKWATHVRWVHGLRIDARRVVTSGTADVEQVAA